MFEEARRPKKVSRHHLKKRRSAKDAKKDAPVKKGVSSYEEQDRGKD
jgi:hypothetical protein